MIEDNYYKVKRIIISCNTKDQLKNCGYLVERYYNTCLRNQNSFKKESIKYYSGKLMGILEYKKDLLLKQCDN